MISGYCEKNFMEIGEVWVPIPQFLLNAENPPKNENGGKFKFFIIWGMTCLMNQRALTRIGKKFRRKPSSGKLSPHFFYGGWTWFRVKLCSGTWVLCETYTNRFVKAFLTFWLAPPNFFKNEVRVPPYLQKKKFCNENWGVIYFLTQFDVLIPKIYK